MACWAPCTSALTWASVSWVKYGCVTEWLPARKPSWTIRFAWEGKSRTQVPVRKNVARTFLARSADSMDGSPAALAPASKVSATTLEVVGMPVQSVPSSELAGAGGSAGAHAWVNPDQAPAR